MNYCNYVIYMPRLQLVKFGITSRLPQRLKEIGRIAAKRGEESLQWAAAEALPGVARITETELRRIWRPWAASGRHEWIACGALDYAELVAQTSRIQSEIEFAMGVGHAG